MAPSLKPGSREATGEFGPFELLVRLGQGGMGEVWKARRRDASSTDPFLVVKRVLPHLGGVHEIMRMFSREARLCARLDHPNIVRVLEFGDVAGEYYLEMEHVDGVNLLAVLRTLGRAVPPPLAAYVVASVARALDYAWRLHDEFSQELHIVHRDVTPSNVMIGFDGRVKLLDFGIAKALAEATESHTATGSLKGKLGYMAPEQIEGSSADHASDQFSAGVVLHEMLTGLRLFRGENDVQTIARVKACVVDPPSEKNAGVPRELDAIALRALAKRPEDRYPDCAALATELERFAEAHGWGAPQTAQLLEEAGLTDPTHVGVLPVAELAPTHDEMKDTVPRRRPAPKRRTGAIVAGVVVLTATFVAGLTMRLHEKPVEEVAPIAPLQVAPVAPVVPTPPPPIVPAAAPAELRPMARPTKQHPKPKPTESSTGKVRAGHVIDPFSH